MINSWQHHKSYNYGFQDSKNGGKETHRKTDEKPEIREHQVNVPGKTDEVFYSYIK